MMPPHADDACDDAAAIADVSPPILMPLFDGADDAMPATMLPPLITRADAFSRWLPYAAVAALFTPPRHMIRIADDTDAATLIIPSTSMFSAAADVTHYAAALSHAARCARVPRCAMRDRYH